MSHPDTNDLARYAAGDGADARYARHIESCASCAAEVHGLRAGLAAMLTTASVDLERGPDCLDDQALAALADGGMTPSAPAEWMDHLAKCSRCRSEVSSIVRTLAAEDVAKELASLSPVPAGKWRASLVGLGAAAVVAALILIPREPTPTPPSPHREGAAEVALAPVTISPEGPMSSAGVLRWHSMRGADRYRVTLFDEDGVVLYETALSDTVAALPDDVVIAPDRSYYWLVAARTGFDRWETSDLAEFSVEAAR